MKRTYRLMFLAAGVVCTSAYAAAPEADVFAPGVVSGPMSEACPAFTPDGETVYFDNGTMILTSHRSHGIWSVPQIAAFSGAWRDHDPAMAPDGSHLVFVSNRPVDGGAQGLGATVDGKEVANAGGNLWRVDRQGSGWGTPVHLPATVNATDRVYAPSISADASLFYIRRGSNQSMQVFRSAYRDGAYQNGEQQALGDDSRQIHDPAIAPDQSFIVFNSNDAKKQGMGNLYIAFREGAGWSAPTDLGESINGKDGAWNPWGAHIGPDKRTLYYASDRTLPHTYPRTPAQAREELARLQHWNNGETNIWSVTLAPWLDAHAAGH